MCMTGCVCGAWCVCVCSCDVGGMRHWCVRCGCDVSVMWQSYRKVECRYVVCDELQPQRREVMCCALSWTPAMLKIKNRSLVQNQNQKSLNVPQTGKFVCHSSNRILQKQKHITRTGTIAKISNKIKKGSDGHIDIFTWYSAKLTAVFVLFCFVFLNVDFQTKFWDFVVFYSIKPEAPYYDSGSTAGKLSLLSFSDVPAT